MLQHLRMKCLVVGLLGSLIVGTPSFAQDPASTAKPIVVPFELVPSGHFIVKVKLNDKGPYNLIFDTGAPTNLINGRIAKDSGALDKNVQQRPLIPLFGMQGQVKLKSLSVGDVQAADVPAMVMDHPTVKVFSDAYGEKYGPIEGIVGFPFFARFKVSVNYATKQMTFTPTKFLPTDVMEGMTKTMMAAMAGNGGKPQPKIVAAQGQWGFVVVKEAKDEGAGVVVEEVLPGSAAAEAGFQKGDRILTIASRWTDTVADTYLAASQVPTGKSAIVTLKRGEKEMKLTIVPRNGL